MKLARLLTGLGDDGVIKALELNETKASEYKREGK